MKCGDMVETNTIAQLVGNAICSIVVDITNHNRRAHLSQRPGVMGAKQTGATGYQCGASA